MAPNVTSQTLLLATQVEPKKNSESGYNEQSSQKAVSSRDEYEWKISWRNVLAFMYLHGAFLYSVFLLTTGHVKLLTFLWIVLTAACGALGVTAGAHRLWAHKAYKAKWPLRLILAIFQTMAFQNHIYEWVRDHRVHHKFTDTDADPHNIKRGFFFAHMGWLMVRKHPDVKSKGKSVDMTDLENDFIVTLQKRTYLVAMPLICFLMPTYVPYYFWNENFWTAWYCTIFRYTLSLHGTWLVNSAAHLWGYRPYEKSISSSENATVSIITFGEGWHNYHHVFPWDYKAAELGNYSVNMTTGFIDFFAKIGWAYNLRSVSHEMIQKRAQRTGDGSLRSPDDPNHHMNNVWGWGDTDITQEDINCMTVNHEKVL
ncbi:hypothetical protein RUM43_003699 [Polyplax serrata]